MKLSVQVKTNSRKESVEFVSSDSYVVRVNVLPIEGRANERVVELLAEYFNVPKSRVNLIKGHKSKKKIFEILK